MHEFEDILNESETEADRFAAFLKLKTATRRQSNPQFLLGSYDISFDFDVDLVKRTEEPPRNGQNLIIESQPQPEIPRLCEDEENLPMSNSFSASPGHRNSLTSSTIPRALAKKSVPSPIHCVDIKCLSQTQKFVDCTLDFQPQLNSTAAPEKQTEIQPKEKRLSTRATGAAIDLTNQDDFETSYLASLIPLKCKGNLPLDLPKRNESTTEAPPNQILVEQHSSKETRVTTPSPTVSELNEVVTQNNEAHEEELNSNTASGGHQTERSSIQLLDLHSSHSNNLCNNRAQRPQKMVLNKPSRPAINGEDFAQELARMSYHDILDLRKRNSMGLPCGKGLQDKPRISKAEQLAVEQHIQSELLRRQSEDETNQLVKLRPLSGVTNKPVEPASVVEFRPPKGSPPIGDKRKRSRRKRREAPMTDELQNYLKLSETLESRVRSRSTNMVKRSLYTKGNSDVEDSLSQSPPKKQRYGYSGIQIVPAPPKNSVCHDGIVVVSPPPASLRFSQAMCQRRRSKRIMSDNLEEVTDAQKDGEQVDVELEAEQAGQENVVQASQEDVEQERQKDVDQASQHVDQDAGQENAKMAIEEEELQQDGQPTDEAHEARPEDGEQPRLEHVEQERHEDDEMAIEEEEKEEEEQMQQQQETGPLIDEGSTHMEALRMETPTPPLPATYEQDVLDEQPSTSKAARRALQMSLSRQQKVGNQQKKQDPGRPKRKIAKDKKRKTYMQCELARLTINLKDETLPPDENELTQGDTTAVRRSRRGQVPLRNVWCHTMADPFANMRALYTGDKSQVKSSARKRKRGQQEELDTVPDTQPSQAEHQGAEIRARAKKRVRIRDEEAVPAETVPAETVPAPEPEPNPIVSLDEQENVAPVTSQTQSSQLLDWLRGISNAKPVTNFQANGEYESMNTSSLAELEFSSLSGIEYAFYCTEDLGAIGYMRLQPLQQRGLSHNKSNRCHFVVLYGKVRVESRLENSAPFYQVVLRTGDMVEVKKGSRFNISNLLDEVSVLLITRNNRNAN